MLYNSSDYEIEFEYVDEQIETSIAQWRMFVGIWELIVLLIGIPANFLVAFISYKLLRNRSTSNLNLTNRNHHICVLSMSMADILFLFGHCPIMFSHYSLNLELNGLGCRFMYFMTHFSTVGSSLSLLWLNLDKYICVRYPIRYYISSSREKLESLIICGWLASIGWSFFFIFGPLAEGFDPTCKVFVHEPYVYYATFVVTFFVLPITLSLLISVYIFVEAVKARNVDYPASSYKYSNMATSNHNNMDGDDSKAAINNAARRRYTVGIELRRCRPAPRGSSMTSLNRTSSSMTWKLRSVTFVFITTVWSSVTLLPYRTAFLVFYFHQMPWLARLAFALFAIMIANAAGNPFITLFTQNQYREKAKRMIKDMFAPRRRRPAASSSSWNSYSINGERMTSSNRWLTRSSTASVSAFPRLRAFTM